MLSKKILIGYTAFALCLTTVSPALAGYVYVPDNYTYLSGNQTVIVRDNQPTQTVVVRESAPQTILVRDNTYVSNEALLATGIGTLVGGIILGNVFHHHAKHHTAFKPAPRKPAPLPSRPHGARPSKHR